MFSDVRLLPKQISFLRTFLQFDPKQKAVCITPTSLRLQTIITAASAKRRRPHRKSLRSPRRPTNPHSDRLSLHTEVTGKHPESSPATPPSPLRRPRHPRHWSPLFVTHLGDIISFLFSVSGRRCEARRRSGSGCSRGGRTH